MRALAGLAAVAMAGCGGADAAAPPPRAAPAPSLLAVRVVTPGQLTGDHATAFGLGARRALTVAHVLGARPWRVRVAAARARVLRVDRRLDLAVLRTRRGIGPSPVRGAAHAGERVTVRVLRPGGARSLAATVRRAISARVRDRRGRIRVRPALELVAAVLPGDSGAPVLDARRRVVGMLFARASGAAALAYALDARALGALLR